MAYSRLSLSERERIFKGVAAGKGVRALARELGRAPSTISHELRRLGAIEDYSPSEADTQARALAKGTLGRLKIKGAIASLVEYRLTIKRYSPEQIAANLKLMYPENLSFHLCHETIYRYLYQEVDKGRTHLTQYLRRRKKRRGRRLGKHKARGQIPNARSIHDRPMEVEKRRVAGHWEGDLIIGKDHQSAIGTLVERTTRYTLVVPLESGKDSQAVTAAFAQALSDLPYSLRRSLTYDRGLEMARHEQLTAMTGMPVYFADPHSPGQRGTNENTNGLIREFFPKKTDFRKVSHTEIANVQNLLNLRPRKVLGFRTPGHLLTSLTTGNS